MLNQSNSDILYEVMPAVNRQNFGIFVQPPLPYEMLTDAAAVAGGPAAIMGDICNEFVIGSGVGQEAAEAQAENLEAFLVGRGVKAVRRDFVSYNGRIPAELLAA